MLTSHMYEDKMMRTHKMKLQNNTEHSMKGVAPGKIAIVNAVDGMPTDKYWRNRLRDAKIDDCVKDLTKHTKQTAKKGETK